MTKAIEFYLRQNVDSSRIREYINELFNEDYTQDEINEAINFIQASQETKGE